MSSEARGLSPQPDPSLRSAQEGEGGRESALLLPAGPAGATGVRRISSEQLLINGAVELQIDHRGVLYRLKQTSLGKLILTK
jgi:hemin uptake protein HemP